MSTLIAKNALAIRDLHAGIDGMEILKGVNLNINPGEIHVVMGPNGSGKSTLLNVLMGHPKYAVLSGEVTFNGIDLLDLEPSQRSGLGLFLAFQHPLEIPGVTFGNFMRLAKNAHLKGENTEAKEIGPAEFAKIMKKNIEFLGMDSKFMGRSLNEGFSGGEKKRAEIVQMAVLEPKMALLDEIDSGLDIDALKAVANAVMETWQRLKCAILLVTHYQRILNFIKPNFVHVMWQGQIVKSGSHELALELENHGYQRYLSDMARV